MKLFTIAALALCLNVSLIHTNDQEAQRWGPLGKYLAIHAYATLIGSGSVWTILGFKKVISSTNALLNEPETDGLNDFIDRQHRCNEIYNGLSLIGAGTVLTIAGYVPLICGLAADIEWLKDNECEQ